MKQQGFLCIALCLAFSAMAQDTTGRRLDELLIYSSKFAEQKKNIVQPIDIISASRIAQVNAQNTGDLLSQTGKVFVQKSQQGGSSPVIRGFEASRVLLVIDGIRMNNAIYRAGHLQNVITIDQNMLERVEVLYGPASTLYGSDALGGVVHMRTRVPALSAGGKTTLSGSAFGRYSSVNNENTVHADLSIGGRKVAWLQSYNFSKFGDLRMGSNYPRKYPNFGRRSQYIASINGVDSIVSNKDDRVQRFSGYSQWDVTQKLLFRPGKNTTHLLNLQYSSSTHVPRYDRLQDIRNGTLRFAEWYYGPQLRTLAAYEINSKGVLFFDEVKGIASYQHIHESRHQREYRRYDRLDNRVEDLDVWGFNLDGRTKKNGHELTLGLDGQLNGLRSTAFRENVRTGARSPLDTRYPNGKNRMNTVGVYAQHLLKFAGGKAVLNDGIRLQHTALDASIADHSIFSLPFTEIRQRHWAVTGNLGMVYMPSPSTRITSGISSGFRSPNIDDLARIFESNSASRQLIIPNPGIGPEYTYNIDLGVSREMAPGVSLEATGFITWFRNAIALSPFQLNGQDSVMYNGSNSQVFANQNVNRARLYGFTGSLTARIIPGLEFFSTITLTRGRLFPSKGAAVPLDHIPPVYGRTALTYTGKRWTAEAFALYNGWKRIRDYNPSGEDNLQYATPDGTPSWATLNVRGSFSVTGKAALQGGVENILDRNYRLFASGFSAPGRNLWIALRLQF